MGTINKEGKIQLNLCLEPDIFKWLDTEAKNNKMSVDKVVEELVYTIQLFKDFKVL